jgi:recombination protein RecA
MFGSPETTTGGNALKFYASIRLDIRRVGSIKVGEDAIGNRTRVKVVKNKLAPPFLACEFDILFGRGISRSGDVIDLATELKIIDKSGAWYSYNGERIGQGRDNSRVFLEEHPQMLNDIEARVFEAKGLKRQAPPKAEEKPNGKAAAADKAAADKASAEKAAAREKRPS